MLQGTAGSNAHAKTLRKTMSLPEIALWRALRDRPEGLKFRKQHPAGPYVADFYCHAARLIVEVDGEAHSRGDRPQCDAARDAWFAARGLLTLRLPVVDLMRDMDSATRGIIEVAKARLADQE